MGWQDITTRDRAPAQSIKERGWLRRLRSRRIQKTTLSLAERPWLDYGPAQLPVKSATLRHRHVVPGTTARAALRDSQKAIDEAFQDIRNVGTWSRKGHPQTRNKGADGSQLTVRAPRRQATNDVPPPPSPGARKLHKA